MSTNVTTKKKRNLYRLFSRKQSLQARVSRQFQRYFGALVWLIRQSISIRPAGIPLIIINSVAGVGFIGLALLVLLRYAMLMEAGQPFPEPFADWPVRDPVTLTAAGLIGMMCLGIGSTLIFLAKRATVHLAYELELFIRSRTIRSFGISLPQESAYTSDRRLKACLVQIQGGDGRKSAIVCRWMFDGVVPVAVIIAGASALVWLHPTASMLIAVVTAIALIFYYLINRGAVSATRRFEALSPAAGAGSRQLLADGEKSASRSGPDIDPDQFGNIEAATAAFRDRFMAAVRSELVGYLLLAVVVSSLVVYLGRQALQEELPWAALIGYLLILRITLGGVRQLFNLLARYSRFYTSVQRVHACLSSEPSNVFENLKWLPVPRSQKLAPDDFPRRVRLRPGDKAVISMPVRVSRYSVGLIAEAFAPRPGLLRNRIKSSVAVVVPPTGSRTTKTLLRESGVTLERLNEGLSYLFGDDELPAALSVVFSETEHSLCDSGQEPVSKKMEARIGLVSAWLSERPLVIVSWGASTHVKDGLEKIRKRGDRIILLSRLMSPLKDNESKTLLHVVIGHNRRLVATGPADWVLENWEAITTELSQQMAKVAIGLQGDDTEDEPQSS